MYALFSTFFCAAISCKIFVPVSNGVEDGVLRETTSLNPTNPIEDPTSGINKQTYRVTSMKRSKPTNLSSNDKLIKPYKRLKPGAASHDQSLSKGNSSKEVSNPPVGHTVDKTKKLFRGKKMPAKQDKGVELKRPMINSARKKGKLSADSRGQKALHKGLQCHAVMVTRSKKSGQSTSRIPQSGVPLTPKTTGNQDNETDGDTSTRRKSLRTFTRQSKARKTSLALIHQNGDAGGKKLPKRRRIRLTSQQEKSNELDKETDGDTSTRRKCLRTFTRKSKARKTSLALIRQNGDAGVKKLPNRRRIELTSQHEKSNKLVKGKQGKRRTISLNKESSPQDSSKHKENGKTDIVVEKSVDTMSEDQPLSSWFLAKLESTGKKPPGKFKFPPSITKNNDQKLSFEKQSSLWETIESMEAFSAIPQRPHFRPFDNLKESDRERHAIYKMVDFSSVFEKTCCLRLDHPRTEIEDQLETLLELETHGFDVEPIRSRLIEMLSFKDKREALETWSKESKDNLENQRVKVQEHNKDIVSIDNQVEVLLNKREGLAKEKRERELTIFALQEKVNGFEEAKCEFRRKFEELATASF